ncbi:hypothetical protein ACHAW6_006973 [Cyclotella cf. meneghiniana]
MMGSLDCSRTIWKSCPKAWAGSYQGKENDPSIMLEGIYHMFFWHASYGNAAILNDKTIFDLSPCQECLLDGSFEEKEPSSGVVPFSIAGEQFNKMFVWALYEFFKMCQGYKNTIDKKCNEVYNLSGDSIEGY